MSRDDRIPIRFPSQSSIPEYEPKIPTFDPILGTSLPPRLDAAALTGVDILAADIYEDDHEIVISFDLPGVDEKDVSVTVNGQVVTVSSERRLAEGRKLENFVRMENKYGVRTRNIALPSHVDPNSMEAVYRNGTMELRLPKRAEASEKQQAGAIKHVVRMSLEVDSLARQRLWNLLEKPDPGFQEDPEYKYWTWLRMQLESGIGATEDLSLSVSSSVSPEQLKATLAALADYVRVCGGLGMLASNARLDVVLNVK